ncbi:MAG: serine/threonine protein kinase [Aggregatilineales bacterium]
MVAHQVIADRFEIGEFIAQGGVGAVYRGLDRQTGQPVAIKRLKRELIDIEKSLLTRFAREGEALRRLDHRNIVKLLATVEYDGEHYLVLEYVSGGSLADRLLNEPRLQIDQTLGVALELADALPALLRRLPAILFSRRCFSTVLDTFEVNQSDAHAR